MDRHDVIEKVKGVVYALVLLVLLILVVASAYCFLLMLVIRDWPWLRVAFAFAGTALIATNVGMVVLLNRFIRIRIVFWKFGLLLYWVSWMIPLFSMILAVAAGIALANGFEIPVDNVDNSVHDVWDWD